MPVIRPETPADVPAIRALNTAAFGRAEEGKVVDAVRARGAVRVSLVAIEDDLVVGHILFSPVSIESDTQSWPAVGLGPMAVHPTYQRRGIGGRLIRDGLDRCRDHGDGIVVVLGHPTYYRRFGFSPAGPRGIQWEQGVPGDPFMVMELRPGALEGCTGVAKYLPEFML